MNGRLVVEAASPKVDHEGDVADSCSFRTGGRKWKKVYVYRFRCVLIRLYVSHDHLDKYRVVLESSPLIS